MPNSQGVTGFETRVRNTFKIFKSGYYRKHGNTSDLESFNDEVWLPLAGMFSIPVRQVKDIVQTKEYFGGGPDA
jgi:hypothetical protein